MKRITKVKARKKRKIFFSKKLVSFKKRITFAPALTGKFIRRLVFN